jgi:hypothetical protein
MVAFLLFLLKVEGCFMLAGATFSPFLAAGFSNGVKTLAFSSLDLLLVEILRLNLDKGLSAKGVLALG